ncbi:MAG: glycosyl transferase family 2 [Methylophaga sp.]|nr:MAG: glycosyl transferase family 2 [Methylophaga sp.]
MDNSIQLSVLMTVYNAELYLNEAVESILNQSYSDFEFIIINDGSTDSSLSILKNYAQLDKRIKLITRENKGIVASRNELLYMASGKYIAIMDSDDISHPQRLQKQLAFLSKNEEYYIVGCQDLLIDPEGLAIKTINNKYQHEEVDAANLRFDEFQTLNAYMTITKELLNIGGYRNKVIYAEDRDVFLRMAEVGKVSVFPEVLYSYRQHYTNICVEKRVEIKQSVQTVVQDAYKRRGLTFVRDKDDSCEQDVVIKDQFRAWAWWSLEAGNTRTALKYTRKLLMRTPFSLSSWQLLLCVMRGY